MSDPNNMYTGQPMSAFEQIIDAYVISYEKMLRSHADVRAFLQKHALDLRCFGWTDVMPAASMSDELVANMIRPWAEKTYRYYLSSRSSGSN